MSDNKDKKGIELDFKATMRKGSIISFDFVLDNNQEFTPPDVNLTINIQSPQPFYGIEAVYSTEVNRLMNLQLIAKWRRAKGIKASSSMAWGNTIDLHANFSNQWQYSELLATFFNVPYVYIKTLRGYAAERWQGAYSIERMFYSEYKYLVPEKFKVALPWDYLKTTNIYLNSSYKYPIKFYKNFNDSWQVAQPVSQLTYIPFRNELDKLDKNFSITYEGAKLKNALKGFKWGLGLDPNTPEPPWWEDDKEPPKPPPPPVSHINLDFVCLSTGFTNKIRMDFVRRCAPVIRGGTTIIVTPFTTLTRVSDGLEIQAYNVEVGTDKDSWSWVLNADIVHTEKHKVEPVKGDLVEVQANLSGFLFNFLVDQFEGTNEFTTSTVKISGRSVTSLLAAPSAPTRTFYIPDAKYSKQIVEEELERFDLKTGFELDWLMGGAIPELGWAVPANTKSFEDVTPIEVAQEVVEGVGGYVHSHPSKRVLMVRPQYSAPFWEWKTLSIDKYIPLTVVLKESIKWINKPAYNGVLVSGVDTGVIATVRRYGTQGEFMAPPYSNALLTDADIARIKGIEVLSSGGMQAEHTFEMPFMPEIGVFYPTDIIYVSDDIGGEEELWRGRVLSVIISSTMSEDGKITTLQTVEVERHLSEDVYTGEEQ